MKVLHVINSLDQGGAENTLFSLVRSDTKQTHIVVSLKGSGFFGEQLEALGVKVIPLNIGYANSITAFLKLYQIIKIEKPQIVQSWLYISDLFASLVILFSKNQTLIWNVRNGSLNTAIVSRSSVLAAKFCSILSFRIPKAIICCSKSSILTHSKFGYDRKKFTLIYNGIDIVRFSFSNYLPRKDIHIGYVGRFDPQKGHSNLFEALSLLKQTNVNFKVILVGQNILSTNKDLVRLINKHKLENNVELRGLCYRMNDLYNELDIHVLPSLSEAFPNVVAESMACGIPNVVTNVGDAADIAGDTGWICKKNDPQSLFSALHKAILEITEHTELFLERKKYCRERISNEFSVEKMVVKYNQIWNNNVWYSRDY
jgi:glycosyltransferase involved in cell wall biosynthesis